MLHVFLSVQIMTFLDSFRYLELSNSLVSVRGDILLRRCSWTFWEIFVCLPPKPSSCHWLTKWFSLLRGLRLLPENHSGHPPFRISDTIQPFDGCQNVILHRSSAKGMLKHYVFYHLRGTAMESRCMHCNSHRRSFGSTCHWYDQWSWHTAESRHADDGHVWQLISRCFLQLCLIKSFIQPLPFEAAKTAVSSYFIVTQVDRCNSILAEVLEYLIDRLQSVLNSVARTFCNRWKHNHVTSLLNDLLHWLPVQYCIDYKLALLVYKWLHGAALE